MPSPLGHALGGYALGALVGGRRARPAIVFAMLGMLPDIDFLFGTHSTYTHSLGAALVVGLATLAWLRGDVVVGAAAAAAYGSHVLLDWMGRDGSPPVGIMALWPFSSGFYLSDLRVFMAIERRYWRPGFVVHNTVAVAREIAILLPIVALVWWARVRLRNSSR